MGFDLWFVVSGGRSSVYLFDYFDYYVCLGTLLFDSLPKFTTFVGASGSVASKVLWIRDVYVSLTSMSGGYGFFAVRWTWVAVFLVGGLIDRFVFLLLVMGGFVIGKYSPDGLWCMLFLECSSVFYVPGDLPIFRRG